MLYLKLCITLRKVTRIIVTTFSYVLLVDKWPLINANYDTQGHRDIDVRRITFRE